MTGSSTNEPGGPVAGDAIDGGAPGDLDKATRSFGTWLRRQREGRGITLREIADTSKISIRYLQAFEDDRFGLLPADVFAKGFLRQYARYVGLDSEEVVNFYLSQVYPQDEDEEVEGAEPPQTESSRGAPPWVYGLAFGLVAALLLGIVGLVSWLGADRQQVPPPGALAVPTFTGVVEASEPLAEGSPDVVAPLRVVLDFSGECWVEARIDGGRRLAELHVQGESLQLTAEEEIELTVDAPDAVQVEVNGQAYTLPATETQEPVRIDLGTVRRLAEGGRG